MKKPLILFVLLFSIFATSQDIIRENISGKIMVEGSDIDGITIFNSSTNLGTVSNADGEFIIAVSPNDLLEIRALEYQNFNFEVNESVLESKKLSIFLIEEVNRLDEIIISSKPLTGNIKYDLSSVKTFSPKLDVMYFGAKRDSDNSSNNNEDAIIDNENLSQITNTTIHFQARTMVNGLNIINVVDQLLIPLFRTSVKDKKAYGISEVPSKAIKFYLGSNFLIENFNIPEHRVEEFIRYVEDETFDFNLLNYGQELDFLELLTVKSKMFLK